MVHAMNLKEIYFNKIKSGEKIYEIRLNDEKRQKIDVGDIILFSNDENKSQSLNTKVEDLIYFKTFDEMLDTLPFSKIGFNNFDKQSIKSIYRSFYSEESEKKYGVVAIKVKVI